MGIIAIVVGALLIGMNAWLVGAAFEPIVREGRGVEYILVSHSFSRFLLDVAGAAALLLMLQVLVFKRHENPRETFLSVAGTRHLRVLWWLALSLLPLVNLLAPLAGRLPALSYLLFDLRFYWWPLVLVGLFRGAGLPLAGSTGWPPTISRRWVLASLVVVPIAIAVISTPHLRFTGALDGDEPKYIRFCENFYQGLGFDISHHRLLTDLGPKDEPRVFDNVRRLLRAVPEEAALLVGDARRFVGASAPVRLVAKPDMFFAGKHAGTVYQLHGPGLSFLLFPGYYLDRRLTGSGVGYQNEFPTSMPAVYVSLLALYAGYALALYGLLLAYGGNRLRAWFMALVGVIALPAGAFAFQIYPEIAAGLILFVLVRDLIAPSCNTFMTFALGLLAGFLPWLHLRFGAATIVIMAAMLMRVRPWSARLSLAAGAAVTLGSLSLYTYRLTGALLPSVPFGPDEPLSFAHVLNGVPGFAFDRVFGMFPHAPIYLLALPGIGVAWRRRPAVAWILALILVVVVTAASHGFQAAGATPDRYLVAVAPLLLLFVADAMMVWSRRRLFVAVFALLTLVSIETAVRYNLHHLKGFGPLVAKQFSGWRFNLLFPSLGTEPWPAIPRDAVLLVLWGAVVVLLIFVPWWRTRRSEPLTVDEGLPMPSVGDLCGTLFAVALLGMIVGVGTGGTMDRQYFTPFKEARERALSAFADMHRCAVCYSSALGAIEPTVSLGNDVSFVDLRALPASPRAGQRVDIRVRPRSRDGEYVVSLVRLELGDGSVATHRRMFGDANDSHIYARPGEYEVHAWVKASSEEPAEARMTVHVVP